MAGGSEGNDLEKGNVGNGKEGQVRQSARGGAILELIAFACREKKRHIRARLMKPGQTY